MVYSSPTQYSLEDTSVNSRGLCIAQQLAVGKCTLALVAFLLVCDLSVHIELDKFQHRPLHRRRNRPWGRENRTL